MNRLSIWMGMGALALASNLAVSQATEVAPDAMWMNGLERIQGTFKFVQISSPGGLWQEDRVGDKTQQTQVSINELPAALREKLKSAQLQLRIDAGSSHRQGDQEPSPGQRGKPPYHGHLRHYEETATGTLAYQGLPGIALADGDSGEFSGKVRFTLSSSVHSDPSDIGVFEERFRQEMIWGAAAQSRNYADLEATAASAGSDDPSAQALANARLLRAGREIIAYLEWKDPSPPAGVTERRIRGSVRLFRVEQ